MVKSSVARVGGPAPHFEGQAWMPDSTFKQIKLDDYKGKNLINFI